MVKLKMYNLSDSFDNGCDIIQKANKVFFEFVSTFFAIILIGCFFFLIILHYFLFWIIVTINNKWIHKEK